MKKLCCIALSLLPMAALAYPIEVQESLANTEITYYSQEITYDMAGILLTNHGTQPARCKAVFRNGPEAPRTRKVLVAPHSQSNINAKFTREILRLRINLSCENA